MHDFNSPRVEQATQWPKEKVQNDKQRSTKQTYKTKDRVTMYIFVLFSLDLIHFDKQHRWCNGNRVRIDFCRPWPEMMSDFHLFQEPRIFNSFHYFVFHLIQLDSMYHFQVQKMTHMQL
jgi:hypothetical protein